MEGSLEEEISKQLEGVEIEENQEVTRSETAENEEHELDIPEQSVREGKLAIGQFLKQCTCYDLMKCSGKVVVFDVNITIRLAYYALVEHSIGAAPLWSPIEQKIVGMVTVSDLVEVLRHGYETKSVTSIIDRHTIMSWRSLIHQLRDNPSDLESLIESNVCGVRAAMAAANERNSTDQGMKSKQSLETEKSNDVNKTDATDSQSSMESSSPNVLIPINPDDSLYKACCQLRMHRIHRLPIVDSSQQKCLGVITHMVLLKYLVSQFTENMPIFAEPIGKLGIGSFADKGAEMVCASVGTPLIQVLHMLAKHGISCVPIIDDEEKVIEVYTRSFVTQLAKHENIEEALDRSIWDFLGEAGSRRPNNQVYTCNAEDSLQTVFYKFRAAEVHRLICVDDQNKLKGIVSLSDLLSYFVDKVPEESILAGAI